MVLEGYLKGGTHSVAVALGRDRLTPREREVVQLLAEGKSTKEVAVALGLSVKTAETHRSNIMRKLQLHSVSDLVHVCGAEQYRSRGSTHTGIARPAD